MAALSCWVLVLLFLSISLILSLVSCFCTSIFVINSCYLLQLSISVIYFCYQFVSIPVIYFCHLFLLSISFTYFCYLYCNFSPGKSCVWLVVALVLTSCLFLFLTSFLLFFVVAFITERSMRHIFCHRLPC